MASGLGASAPGPLFVRQWPLENPMKYTERAKYALAIARANQFLDRIEELIVAGDNEAAKRLWESARTTGKSLPVASGNLLYVHSIS